MKELFFWGLVFLAGSIGAGVWLKKRAFERTNSAGVEEFSGFGKVMGERAMHWLAGLFFVVGLVMTALGSFIFL